MDPRLRNPCSSNPASKVNWYIEIPVRKPFPWSWTRMVLCRCKESYHLGLKTCDSFKLFSNLNLYLISFYFIRHNLIHTVLRLLININLNFFFQFNITEFTIHFCYNSRILSLFILIVFSFIHSSDCIYIYLKKLKVSALP